MRTPSVRTLQSELARRRAKNDASPALRLRARRRLGRCLLLVGLALGCEGPTPPPPPSARVEPKAPGPPPTPAAEARDLRSSPSGDSTPRSSPSGDSTPRSPPSGDSTPTPAQPAAKELVEPTPAGEVVDLWSSVSLLGQHTGYNHLRIYADETGALVQVSRTSMSINRGGQVVSVRRDALDVESPQGAPLRGWMRMVMSQQDIVADWHVEGDELVLDLRSAGSAQTRRIPVPPGAIGPIAAQRRTAAAVQAKQDVTAVTWNAESQAFVRSDGSYRGADATDGVLLFQEIGADSVGQIKAVRFDVTMDNLPGLVVPTWVDGDGREVRSEAPLLGVTFVSQRTSKEEALRAPQALPEVLYRSSAPLQGGQLESPFDGAAVYRISLPEGARLVDDDRQRPLEDGLVRIGSAELPERAPLPLAAPDAPDALLPGPYIQSRDERIVAIAEEVAGDSSDGAVIAARLAAWVNEHVEEKRLGVAFASAREVLDTRAGDCTEHALLLAALLRAAGVPARVATGLVYSPLQNAFIGHMWTEAWLGAWVGLDATVAPRAVGPGHLKLGQGVLNDGGLLETFYAAVRALGALEITLVREE